MIIHQFGRYIKVPILKIFRKQILRHATPQNCCQGIINLNLNDRYATIPKNAKVTAIKEFLNNSFPIVGQPN